MARRSAGGERATVGPADGDSGAGHRARLLDGMAAAVEADGYARTTVADIVRHAGVSKRTFYEHFADKEECLLALYEAASARALRVVADAADAHPDVEGRIDAATDAYLALLHAHPAVVRTLLVEILAAGAPGLAVRQGVNRRFARLLRTLPGGAAGARLSPAAATALVGGINELVLEAVLSGRGDRLRQLRAPVRALARALATATAAGE